MTICLTCTNTFLANPQNLIIVGVSLVLALISVVYLIRKQISNSKKLGLIYAHLFFLAFPFIYFFYNSTCGRFYSCGFQKAILYSLPASFIIAVVACFFIAPLFFTLSLRKLRIQKSNFISRFVNAHVEQFKIRKPLLYVLNTAEPLAFSFSQLRPRIFISVGLTDLLKSGEVEAVLLHELGHIKNRSSLLKLGDSLLRFLSPVSAFSAFDSHLKKWLQKEEAMADAFARDVQGTEKHLNSAKAKIHNYYKAKDFVQDGFRES